MTNQADCIVSGQNDSNVCGQSDRVSQHRSDRMSQHRGDNVTAQRCTWLAKLVTEESNSVEAAPLRAHISLVTDTSWREARTNEYMHSTKQEKRGPLNSSSMYLEVTLLMCSIVQRRYHSAINSACLMIFMTAKACIIRCEFKRWDYLQMVTNKTSCMKTENF